MKALFAKTAKTLELDKILSLLAAATSTEDAARAAEALLPETDLSEVERLLAQTKAAYAFLARYAAPGFGSAKDPAAMLRRAEAHAVLSRKELLTVCETLRVIRGVKVWRNNCADTTDTVIDPYFDALIPQKQVEDSISFAILSEEEMNDHASAALYDIRRKIAAKSDKIRETLDKFIKGPTVKYLQEAIVTQRDGRFVVPLKAEYKGQVAGIVHDTSATGSTYFIEPMAVVETGNEIRVLKLREEEEIDRILTELSAMAGAVADSVIRSYEALVQLDLIFAKAGLAYNMKATFPTVNSEGKTYLKNARHPLIPQTKVVPVTVELGDRYDTLVITGPNTGGKTVTLKTVGLLTVMTMCGLMIPVDDGSRVAVFRGIFADIGDEQSIEQSLSTFSSHMVNIIHIVRQADENSLVLFDELCAGTDPVEGAALAKAILMRLHEAGAKIVATTHYPELKSYAIDADRVENASCEFDVATLKPTYRLIMGMPGRSNAFAISGRLGLDQGIIAAAKAEVSDEDSRFERVVAALQAARRKAEREQEKARKLRKKAAEWEEKAKKAEEETEAKREKVMEETRREATVLLERAREKSAALLNSLEETQKKLNAENAAKLASEARAETRKTLSEMEKDADPVVQRAPSGKPVEKLSRGDSVLIADLGKEATVLEIKEKEKKAQVVSGAIKMWVPFENLRLRAKKEPAEDMKKTRSITGMISRGQRQVSAEIDLRGMAADEAILELDQYIDNAVLSGIGTVTVIHGKGTGVLRQAVQAHLRSHRNIKSFRLGTFGEGEDGVTVAELEK